MNQAQLSTNIAKFNARQGPRAGDYVITPDGVYRRIACDWGMELQTGTEALFFLSDGYMNFSGRLDLIIPRSKITPTDLTKPGDCKFEQQEVKIDHKVWRAEGAYRLKFRKSPFTRPMVIELLGVSGVGKTTLTEALANRLQGKGYTVRTITGSRDRLLSRSLTRGFQTLWSWSPRRSPLTSNLMQLLPPRNPLWAIRLRGYCSQLLGQSTEGADIVILDQGWIQFVCSLVLLSHVDGNGRIAKALAQIPKPDIVARIHAPLDVVEERVRQRHQRLGTIQRWLELDLTASSQVRVVEMISEILSGGGQRFVELDCSDRHSSTAAIEAMLPEIEPYQWT